MCKQIQLIKLQYTIVLESSPLALSKTEAVADIKPDIPIGAFVAVGIVIILIIIAVVFWRRWR